MKSIFVNDQVPAVVLLAAALSRYGVEVLERQPEFLREDIERDYDIKISDLQSDRLQATLTIIGTDMFESQWEVFETICHLLNGVPATFEDSTPLEAEDLAAALAQYSAIVEALGEDFQPQFSDEVRRYVGVVFKSYGLSSAPSIFKAALIPECPTCEDTNDKHKALSELFDFKKSQIKEYMQTLSSQR